MSGVIELTAVVPYWDTYSSTPRTRQIHCTASSLRLFVGTGPDLPRKQKFRMNLPDKRRVAPGAAVAVYPWAQFILGDGTVIQTGSVMCDPDLADQLVCAGAGDLTSGLSIWDSGYVAGAALTGIPSQVG
jgi:hypothetical protein